MSETFAQRCDRMRENGNPDPAAKPQPIQGRAPNDFDALWHHAANLEAWGDIGWLRVAELEAGIKSAITELDNGRKLHALDILMPLVQ